MKGCSRWTCSPAAIIEVGTVEHEGHSYTALGATITPEHVVGYLSSGGWLTAWDGQPIGRARIVATWRTPQSYISHEMHQVEAVVNGVRYTGRCAGEGMIFKGRRVSRQKGATR